MIKDLRDLLAAVNRAGAWGGGLHPALRVALQAQGPFPAHSSGPAQTVPEGVTRLADRRGQAA